MTKYFHLEKEKEALAQDNKLLREKLHNLKKKYDESVKVVIAKSLETQNYYNKSLLDDSIVKESQSNIYNESASPELSKISTTTKNDGNQNYELIEKQKRDRGNF